MRDDDRWDRYEGALPECVRLVQEAISILHSEIRLARRRTDTATLTAIARALPNAVERIEIAQLLAHAEPEQPAAWVRHLESRIAELEPVR